MKKFAAELVAGLVLVGLAALPSAFAQTSPAGSIVVTNNTSYPVNGIYASASDSSSDWDTNNNLLATGQTIQPGQQATVTVPGASTATQCSFDVMAILYGAGQHAYQYSIDACSSGAWTISSSPN